MYIDQFDMHMHEVAIQTICPLLVWVSFYDTS